MTSGEARQGRGQRAQSEADEEQSGAACDQTLAPAVEVADGGDGAGDSESVRGFG